MKSGDEIIYARPDSLSATCLFFSVAGAAGDSGRWNWEQDLVQEWKVLTPRRAGTGGNLEPRICKIWEDSGFRNLALPILGQNMAVTLPAGLCCHLSSL